MCWMRENKSFKKISEIDLDPEHLEYKSSLFIYIIKKS